MDPTTRFFSKLKKLAVTLESETAKLQHVFENRNDESDSETTARAMRAYHELNCNVGNLKEQVQEQLAQQKARENEVSSFIKACRVMEQRVTEDIQTLKEHWEKYGYQAPQDAQRPTRAESHESAAEDEVANENENNSAGGEGGGHEEAGSNHSSSPPRAGPPPSTDVLRTPQLSDFGLSEMELKRALAGAEWCSEVLKVKGTKGQESAAEDEVASEKEITSVGGEGGGQEEAGGNHFSSPPKVEPLPFTDVLRTPQLSDFGLSEMQLEKTLAGPEWCSEVPPMPEMSLPRPSLNTPSPPPVPITPKCALRMDDDELQTPQMHDFGITEHTMCLNNDFTMDLRRKTMEKPPRPPQDKPVPSVNSLMESLQAQADHLESPETPEFYTPGFKIRKTNGHCSPHAQSNGDPESPSSGVSAFQTAYMSQVRSAKMLKKTSEHEKVTKEPTVNNLELDGPTQEFSLGTPHLRMDFQEPSTPDMLDLSCITQDIHKLVSLSQLKKTAVAVVHPHVIPEKDKHSAVSVSVVSEGEFQSLPSYLRQMTLYNLNQAIHNINKFTAECPGEKTDFQMEELRRITNVGTKTPVYILCLTELKRLTHVGGARNTSVYKLNTQN